MLWKHAREDVFYISAIAQSIATVRRYKISYENTSYIYFKFAALEKVCLHNINKHSSMEIELHKKNDARMWRLSDVSIRAKIWRVKGPTTKEDHLYNMIAHEMFCMSSI